MLVILRAVVLAIEFGYSGHILLYVPRDIFSSRLATT